MGLGRWGGEGYWHLFSNVALILCVFPLHGGQREEGQRMNPSSRGPKQALV